MFWDPQQRIAREGPSLKGTSQHQQNEKVVRVTRPTNINSIARGLLCRREHHSDGSSLRLQADSDAWDFDQGRWLLDDDEYKPLNYLGGRTYSVLTAPFDAEVQQRSPEQMQEEGLGRELEEVEVERARKREEAEEARDEQTRRGDAEPDTSALPRPRPEA